MRPALRRLALVLMAAQVAVLAVAVASPPATRAAGHAVATGGDPATKVSAIVPGSVGRTSINLSATYSVFAKLGWSARSLGVATYLTVRNDSGAGIDRIEFNTVAARLGRLQLTGVSVDGVSRTAATTVRDQTIIVPLGGTLPAGKSADLRVAYHATMRSGTGGSDWMFTRANGVLDLYRWIPWVSRELPFSRPNHGDPFITPVSPQLSVQLTSDRPLVIAATGIRVSTTNGGRTQLWRASQVRDFVLTAAPDYVTATRAVGSVTLRALVRPGTSATTRLDAAESAFRSLVARLGPYPYSVFWIAQSAGGFAMEGPGIIWIPTGTSASSIRYQATHETAHQWFYGIVGNDQATAPFVDEAAADFMTRTILGSFRASGCSTGYLDRSIYEYSSACYYETVYVQGSRYLDDLRRRIGDSRFWPAVRSYLAAYRWKIAPRTALLDAIDAATSSDLTTLYEGRFPRWY